MPIGPQRGCAVPGKQQYHKCKGEKEQANSDKALYGSEKPVHTAKLSALGAKPDNLHTLFGI